MNPQTGLFDFLALVGDIVVDVSSDVYETIDPRGTIIQIVPGHNSHIIEVVKSCGFILILKEGEKIIPYESEWHISPVPVKDRRLFDGYTSGPYPEGRRFTVPRPGQYEFNMPEILGYLPVPEQKVLVKPGEFTEHVIQLQREN